MIAQKHLEKIFLFLILFVYFAFGAFHFTKSVTTDEQYWIYTRIPQYWQALKTNTLKDTAINDKPGVSLALVDLPAFLVQSQPKSHMDKSDKTFSAFHAEKTEKLYATYRLPVFLFNGFFAIYFFWILRKIFKNGKDALWATAFIVLSPILLGISRIVNPDSLLWTFAAAAIFTYLAYIKKRSWKLILLTTFFTGLSLLTKYVANILFLFYFSVIILDIFLNHDFIAKHKTDFSNYLKKRVLDFIFIAAGATATFAILMPAALLKTKLLYKGTLGFAGLKPFLLPMGAILLFLFADAHFNSGKITSSAVNALKKHKKALIKIFILLFSSLLLLTISNWLTHNGIIDLSGVPIDSRDDAIFSSQPPLSKLFLQTYPFVFTLTPIVLLLMLFSLLKLILKFSDDLLLEKISLTLFILMVFFGGIFEGVLLTPRYEIFLFPVAALLAGIGLSEISRLPIFTKNRNNLLLSLVIIIFLFLPLWNSKPFYYSYASPLLPKQYPANNSWGFGGYQAAQFLNSLPDAKNVTVWADFRGTCEFFVGKCIIKNRFDHEKYPIDYYVITKRGQTKMYDALVEQFEKNGQNPAWSMDILDRPQNYIRVYKNSLPEQQAL